MKQLTTIIWASAILIAMYSLVNLYKMKRIKDDFNEVLELKKISSEELRTINHSYTYDIKSFSSICLGPMLNVSKRTIVKSSTSIKTIILYGDSSFARNYNLINSLNTKDSLK